MNLPKQVTIREVGCREGFQSLPFVVTPEKKVALIESLARTGVKEIEVCAFVRPDRVPQMADAEQIVQKLNRADGVRFTALYLNVKGFERAETAGNALDNDGWIPIAISETFLKRNSNLTLDQLVASLAAWEAAFHAHKKRRVGLMISTAFGCNDEGVTTPEKFRSVLSRILPRLEAPPAELCLADTMGWATPSRVSALVELARKLAPASTLSLHLHDTRGCGIASAYAGLEAGIEIFDASLGGVGGCPFAPGATGNICTEDLVYLCETLGISTGIALERYFESVRLLENLVPGPLPGRCYSAWKALGRI